jgi:DNA replication protein DnaC
MLRDTNLAATALRICAERGIEPSDYREHTPVRRQDFYRDQAIERINRRWAGRFDHAQPTKPVAAWIARHLAAPQAEPSLFLAGPTGVGKTFQAVAVLYAIGLHLADQGRGLTWHAVTHPDLADQLRPKTDNSHEYALDRYLDAELLILDDIGATVSSAWSTECIQRLIDHRWTRRATTIYTTNLEPAALNAAIGDRAYSRIGDGEMIQLVGDDRRWTR